MKNWLLMLSSVLITLLACEVAVRYMIDAWPFEEALSVRDHLTARDRTLRWRYPPSKGRNSLGLRNREVSPKKEGIFRILFLGDSLIWAGETSSGELSTAVLEQRLNLDSKNRPYSYEVINAGIPGYTTYQELEFLKIYGLAMEPDLVILGFAFNDLYYKYLHKPTKDEMLSGDPTRHLHHFNTAAFPLNLFARSYLAHISIWRGEILWRRIFQKPVFPFELRSDFYLAWKDYGWIHAQKLIGEMQNLLRDKGVPLLVVVFPVSDQVNELYRSVDRQYVLYPQSMMNGICVGYNLPMLDLTDSLYLNGGISLFADYLHLNAKGNDVVVDKIEEYLVTGRGRSHAPSVSAPLPRSIRQHSGSIPLPFDSPLQSEQALLATAPAHFIQRIVNESTTSSNSGRLLAFLDKLIVDHHVRSSHLITSRLTYTQQPRLMCIASVPSVSLSEPQWGGGRLGRQSIPVSTWLHHHALESQIFIEEQGVQHQGSRGPEACSQNR